MKLLNSKKSNTEEITEAPFKVIYVCVIGLITLLAIRMANVNLATASTVPNTLEDEMLLITRFYSSEDCFAYVDNVGRVYPGTIDANKFTQENLEKCFPYSSVDYAFSLMLKAETIPYTSPEIKTPNYKENYIVKKVINKEVFVYAAGSTHIGTLIIHVFTPT